MRWPTSRTAGMWNAANIKDGAKYREAIIYWAHRRVDLPGPIVFTLSPDDQLEGKRQVVLDESESCCVCGARRLYIPQDVRPYFERPNLELITLREQGPPLAIAFWGGDLTTSIAELSIVEGRLYSQFFPYDTVEKWGVRASWQQLSLLAHERQGSRLAAGVKFKVTSPKSPNPYQLEPYAIYDVDPGSRTITVAISRNCKQADIASRALAHVCS